MDKVAPIENSLPIYLGYEKDQKKYYFYAIKDKIPRFLVYISYFYWDKGPQSVLTQKPVPEEVELELYEYLKDKLSYEFFKPRKNSKEKSVRKIYRLPAPLSPDEREESDPVVGDGRADNLGNGVREYPDVERSDSGNEPARRRRARRSILDVSPKQDANYSIITEVPEVKQRKQRVKRSIEVPVMKVPEVIEPPVEAPKKRRGRQPMIKILENPNEVIPKDDGISKRLVKSVEPTETNVVKKPRKPRAPK